MIQVERVTKRFGGRVVLRDVSFAVAPGERVSLIGPNGAGKSTLLHVIRGAIPADAGRITVTPGTRTGYLPQALDREAASLEALVPSLWLSLYGDARVGDAASALAAADPADEAALRAREEAYETLLASMESVMPPGELAAIAQAMGADLAWCERRPGALSGGELAKLALLDLVAGQPGALLLDEPSNHLDAAGIEWLEHYIASFAGPVLVISHDRALLERLSDVIVALDARDGSAETWRGDYTSWAEEQARRLEVQWQAYEREQRAERALRREISAIESRSRAIEQGTIHFHYRKRARKVARRATTLKARLQRQSESGERTERPAKAVTGLHASFSTGDDGASRLVEVAGATIAVDDRVLLEDVSLEVQRGRRTFITGPNGSGKSTLLRAITGESAADRALVRSGLARLAGSARVGVLWQDDDTPGALGDTPVDVLRRAGGISDADAVEWLHRFVIAHDVTRQPVARLSPGERQRLRLGALIVGGANLLLLDEPTNHLDLPSREAFEAVLEAYEGAVLAVSHDRYFIERFADEHLAIAGGRLLVLAARGHVNADQRRSDED